MVFPSSAQHGKTPQIQGQTELNQILGVNPASDSQIKLCDWSHSSRETFNFNSMAIRNPFVDYLVQDAGIVWCGRDWYGSISWGEVNKDKGS